MYKRQLGNEDRNDGGQQGDRQQAGHAQPAGDVRADRLGQPRAGQQRAQGDAAAEEQDGAPVDLRGLVPVEGCLLYTSRCV